MTESEVRQAFRAVIAEEFEDIPDENGIEHEFSEGFKSKMETLFKRIENGRAYGYHPRKKAVIIAAAAILISLMLMTSVGSVRNPVVDFVYKIYDGFTEIFYKGDTTVTISYIYSFTEIPEGFVETDRISNEGVNIVRYENHESGDIIELRQNVTYDGSFSLDNEHGIVKKHEINGNEVNVYISDYGYSFFAFWNDSGYSIELTYSGKISEEELIEMIKTIK